MEQRNVDDLDQTCELQAAYTVNELNSVDPNAAAIFLSTFPASLALLQLPLLLSSPRSLHLSSAAV